jgi:hypothetical protein
MSKSYTRASSTSIAVYLPVKGNMALSNDVCLRSERLSGPGLSSSFRWVLSLASISFTVGHILSAKREKSCALKVTSVFVVKSCQEPRTRPESSDDGSEPSSVDRGRPPMHRIALGGWIHQSLGIRHAVSQDARTERDGSKRGNPAATTDELAHVQLSFRSIR